MKINLVILSTFILLFLGCASPKMVTPKLLVNSTFPFPGETVFMTVKHKKGCTMLWEGPHLMHRGESLILDSFIQSMNGEYSVKYVHHGMFSQTVSPKASALIEVDNSSGNTKIAEITFHGNIYAVNLTIQPNFTLVSMVKKMSDFSFSDEIIPVFKISYALKTWDKAKQIISRNMLGPMKSDDNILSYAGSMQAVGTGACVFGKELADGSTDLLPICEVTWLYDEERGLEDPISAIAGPISERMGTRRAMENTMALKAAKNIKEDEKGAAAADAALNGIIVMCNDEKGTSIKTAQEIKKIEDTGSDEEPRATTRQERPKKHIVRPKKHVKPKKHKKKHRRQDNE